MASYCLAIELQSICPQCYRCRSGSGRVLIEPGTKTTNQVFKRTETYRGCMYMQHWL